jgi:hypothetical protein
MSPFVNPVSIAFVVWFGLMKIIVFPIMAFSGEREENVPILLHVWDYYIARSVMLWIGIWLANAIGDAYRDYIAAQYNGARSHIT